MNTTKDNSFKTADIVNLLAELKEKIENMDGKLAVLTEHIEKHRLIDQLSGKVK